MTLWAMGFSLLGILFGYLLRKIAPEELKPGKKYFILFERVLFILISLFVVIYFVNNSVSMIITILFIVLSAVLFILQLKIKNQLIRILPFILFLSAVIFYPEQNFYLVLSSLIFIYGLPVGTMLKIK